MSEEYEGMAPHPVELTDELKRKLNFCATATLVANLQGRGITSTFFSGLKPTRPGMRMVGYALTLRYVALREDMRAELGGGINAQRRAVGGCGKDEVIVIEARYEPNAGTCGDIFATEAMMRGAAGLITDGALRDTPVIQQMEWPTYHQSSHAATLGRLHIPLETNVPISCAGVLVMPGDIIVGDDEGAMVIPHALVDEVADQCYQTELREMFAAEKVGEGQSSTGLFPLSDERRPEFEDWLAARGD
ncbi:MAG: hypothetical protein GY929_10460 [Actinomycetia bacterium]|nr:hypothetical protein [Actinomycetes bacterium]